MPLITIGIDKLRNMVKETYVTGKSDSYRMSLGQGREERPIILREEEVPTKNTTSLKSFHYLEDGSVEFSILETKYSTKKLDCGVYSLGAVETNSGWKIQLSTSKDKELFTEDLGFYYEDKIANIYSKFFLPEIKEKVNTLGYNHKLGILLYGIQGTGKTTMFKKYFNDAVKNHNALVFDIKINHQSSGTQFIWDFIQDIRGVQDNPIIIFFDEFDEYFPEHQRGQEDILKKILDGTDSVDNTMFFMTTNYIDRIPETIKDRPSRIKYSIKVEGIQDEKLIIKFLKQSFDKINMEVDFKDEVSKMKGWTINELKQWVLDKVMDIKVTEKVTKKLGF